MRRAISYPVMIALVTLLALASSVVIVEVNSQPFYDFDITIEPSVPTSSTDVEVTVSFDFSTQPPYVQEFGPLAQTGDTISVNVTICVPTGHIVLPILHTDAYTYNLGSLAVGGYVFRVYVQHIDYDGIVCGMVYGSQVLFTVTFLGDVDHDYDVDIFDVIYCAFAYGSTPSSPNWNPYCDVAEPYGFINILDIVTIAANYGQRYTP